VSTDLTSGTAAVSSPKAIPRRRKPLRLPRVVLHVFLTLAALLWLAPIAWSFYTSFRSFDETAENGYVSLPTSLTLDNYKAVWNGGDIPHLLFNTMLITIPAVIITLFLAACVAFVVSRRSFRFNILLLIVFMAANLLPQQVLLTPLFRLYLRIPLPDFISDSGLFYNSYIGIIAINIAFQLGFCVFVLSNYMKTIPDSLSEAARVDGASLANQFFKINLPLCRPALAALATLEFTWIYNDFLWAAVLLPSGDKRPITSAIANLKGQFFTDPNLLAAGGAIIALPTIIVFALLQRHFVRGLTLGATKG
jgi:multiple sugar transport system permease protein